jgi:hypothetical protein
MVMAACYREGAMSRSGLKWSAVGVAALVLVALGAHLAWEQHRYRLRTPRGTVRVGMTWEEVNAAMGTELLRLTVPPRRTACNRFSRTGAEA